MTSTRAINAAAGVIHAAMQQGKTLPASIAYALDSACLLNSPELAAELETLRKLPAERAADHRTWQHDLAKLRKSRDEADQLRKRVAELEAAAGDGSTRTVDEDPIAFSLTAQAEALHASSGAVVEVPEDVSPVADLRALLARPAEDPHDSPLHHTYERGRDLPEVPR